MKKSFKIILCLIISCLVFGSFAIIFIENTKINNLERKLSIKNSEIDDYKSNINHISLELNSLKLVYEKQLNDLKENKVITRTQLVGLMNNDINGLSSNFTTYEAQFRRTFEQMKWIKDNLSPIIENYAKYIKATASASSLIPLPYLRLISDKIERSVSFIQLINIKLNEINEIKISMEKVKLLNEKYINEKNENILFETSNEIGEVLIVRINSIVNFSEDLVDACDKGIESLKNIKELKVWIEDKSKSGLAKIGAYLFSSNQNETDNSNKTISNEKQEAVQLDSIDNAILDLSARTAIIKQTSQDISESFKKDKNSFANIMFFNKVVKIIDNK
jgi:hypothetical protein